jgi:DNA-binding PucR family transcriptional regulator
MSSELQDIVDDLAQRLDAPTVLEDHEERMVVYSSHSQPIDEVRRDSILRRATRHEVMAWFREQGILEAREPLRIPSQPGDGILGRLCVPVRHRGCLMGWLFLIDDRQLLTDAEVATARRAAGHAALLLYEEQLAARLASGALSHLLSPAEDLREDAATQIADQGLLPGRGPVAIAVAQPLGLDEREARQQVSEALRDVARGVGPHRSQTCGQALQLACADHAVVLVRAGPDEGAAEQVADAVAAVLRRRVTDTHGARVVAAVGDPQARVADAHLSYRQARLAAKVAAVVPAVGEVARWRDLGVFRTLAMLPESAAESSLDPRVSILFTDGSPELVTTLEVYLDLGCDAKAASERLHLHRATLYYRLEKVARLTDANLRDGNDRLALHLGFKLARLAGLHPCPGWMPGAGDRSADVETGPLIPRQMPVPGAERAAVGSSRAGRAQ